MTKTEKKLGRPGMGGLNHLIRAYFSNERDIDLVERVLTPRQRAQAMVETARAVEAAIQSSIHPPAA